MSEIAYNNILKEILEKGVETPDRTGVGCYKVFNKQIVWEQGVFPFCTSRPLSPRLAWEEMSLFIHGDPDTKKLEEKGVYFWQANTNRNFLDKQGLYHLPEGSLGTAYSIQFRKAGQSIKGVEPIDQLYDLYQGLANDPFSRRHSIDLWGLLEQDNMPLLPCWWRSNWSVELLPSGKKVLHVKLYSRSNDIVFGYWFAAMQYKMLQMAMADLLGYECGMLVTDMWDVHVYKNQVEYAKEILSRDLGKPGTVSITKELNSFDDLISLEYSDFDVVGWEPNRQKFVTPRPPVAA